MNRMMKKTTSLFPFALAVLLAFFWSGCGDSEEKIVRVNDEDSELIDEDEDENGDEDVESSSKKKSSSSSKKSTASSSSVKSSDSKKASSSSSTKTSSSSKVKSSSSKRNTVVFPEHSGTAKTVNYSTRVIMRGSDGLERTISTDFEDGLGVVKYYENGDFNLKCAHEDFECIASSFVKIPGGAKINDHIKVSFDFVSEGSSDKGSISIVYHVKSENGEEYEVVFMSSLPDADGVNVGPDKGTPYQPQDEFQIGDTTYTIYLVKNVEPGRIVVVVNPPVKCDDGCDFSAPLDSIIVRNPNDAMSVDDSVWSVGVETSTQSKTDTTDIPVNAAIDEVDSTIIDISNIKVTIDGDGIDKLPKSSSSKGAPDNDFDGISSFSHTGDNNTVDAAGSSECKVSGLYRFMFLLTGNSNGTCYDDGFATLHCDENGDETCSVTISATRSSSSKGGKSSSSKGGKSSSSKGGKSSSSKGSNGNNSGNGGNGSILSAMLTVDEEYEEGWIISVIGTAYNDGETSDVLEYTIYPCSAPQEDISSYEQKNIIVDKQKYKSYYKSEIHHYEISKPTTVHTIVDVAEGCDASYEKYKVAFLVEMRRTIYVVDFDAHFAEWQKAFNLPDMLNQSLGARTSYSKTGFGGDAEFGVSVK